MASSSVQSRLGCEQATVYGLAELVNGRLRQRRKGLRCKSRRAQHAFMIRASSAAPYGPGHGGSELVDSNMSVLRKRIQRLRSLEMVDGVPEEWMEWEKTVYSSYRADVAYVMADLQSHLLRVRPSFTIFLMSVLLSAVPVTFLLFLRAFIQP